METKKVEVLKHVLSFYCDNKNDCNRKYTCIIPGIMIADVCEHLIAKSDREFFDSIHRNSEVKTQ